MNNNPLEQKARDFLAIADKALAEDDDHMIATGDDLSWLIAQLAEWPIRVHPERTTNDRFLRMSAAATLRAALSASPASTGEGVEIERDGLFCDRVWEALKGDHTDLRKQALILDAYRAALSSQGVRPDVGEIERLVDKGVDSGFDGDSVARAEWLWANLPVRQKWTSLATHEKALAIHTIAALSSQGVRPDVGEVVTYEVDYGGPSNSIHDATFVGVVEGWFELEFSDYSRAIVRPSRVRRKVAALSPSDQGERR